MSILSYHFGHSAYERLFECYNTNERIRLSDIFHRYLGIPRYPSSVSQIKYILSVAFCSPIVEVEEGYVHISGGNVAFPSMYVFTTLSANRMLFAKHCSIVSGLRKHQNRKKQLELLPSSSHHACTRWNWQALIILSSES